MNKTLGPMQLIVGEQLLNRPTGAVAADLVGTHPELTPREGESFDIVRKRIQESLASLEVRSLVTVIAIDPAKRRKTYAPAVNDLKKEIETAKKRPNVAATQMRQRALGVKVAPASKKSVVPQPVLPDNENLRKLKVIVQVLDDAGIPRKRGDETPIPIEERVQLMRDELDLAQMTAPNPSDVRLDSRRIEHIVKALDTPAVRLMLGRAPTTNDVWQRVLDEGIMSLTAKLKP